MTVGHIEQALQQSLWRIDQSLVFVADRDLVSTLTLGQIISGRVMRHYEGGRYGVSFNGREHVVDSSIPLRNGELIHGRVIGLDDKVHLQRVGTAMQQGRPSFADAPAAPAEGGVELNSIQELFVRYRAPISAQEQAAVRTLGRSAGDLALVASSALVLRKLGLALDRSLIRAVARALSDPGDAAKPMLSERASSLTADAVERVSGNEETTQALARALSQLRFPEQRAGETGGADLQTAAQAGAGARGEQRNVRGDSREDSDRQRQQQEWLLGRRLLNVQNGGSVAHRYLTLPLWLGERFVELNMAFFSQTPEQANDSGVRHRRIVLSIELDVIGRVDVVVTVADRRVRVAFETDSDAATDRLASALGDLKAEIERFDWELDELTYATRSPASLNLPAQAVVSHHVRQDSLSRLL